MTRVEIVVVLVIILLLAGIALGPLTRGFKAPNESAHIQIAHQIGAIEFVYSNDHKYNYPYGPDGHSIANLLLNDGYINDPTLFYFAPTPNAAKYTGSTKTYELTAANCNWDFWVNGNMGLTSTVTDETPLVQMTTGIALGGLPTKEGTGYTLQIDPTKTAFGPGGISVYYKGNYAVFIKCHQVSPTSAVNTPDSAVPFVGLKYADPDGASYHSVLP